MTLSKTFEIVGNYDIGLWLTKREESPFLKIGIILATLKASGNMPVVNKWFIIIVRDLLNVALNNF